MSKFNWNNLTKDERSEYMSIQTTSRFGGHSAYLPDDCTECPSCSQPTLGSGLCRDCFGRWQILYNKLTKNNKDN